MSRLFALVAVLVVVLAGCGGDDGDDAAAPRTTTAPAADIRCQPAASDLMTPLSNGLKSDEHRLRNGQIVESRDHDRIYFVSAEIYGADLGDDAEIGTWATSSIGGAEAIWTVDDVAKKYSDLRDGTKVPVSR